MISLPELFGATYLINLPERTDRLKSAKVQFTRANWSIGGSGVHIFPALRYAESAGFPDAATRGCFQSHLACLQLAQGEGRQNVLILEDDIALTSSLPRLTPAINSWLGTQGWDFVYFGHYGTGDIPSADKNTIESQISFEVWTNSIVATHFYAVSGRILPRLIAHLHQVANGRPDDPTNPPMPVDGAYNVFRRTNPDVRCWIASPKLGWQRASRSDNHPRFYDEFKLLRPLVSTVRNLKHLSNRWRS
jgi:hypothetical protein